MLTLRRVAGQVSHWLWSKTVSPTAKLLHTSRALCQLDSTIIGTDNVVRSPYPKVDVPNVNLYTHVYRDFPKYGRKTAIINGVTGREYSFNELDEQTSKLSSALNRMGLGKGDVLAICAPNSPEYSTMFFATLASGATISTCNPVYTAEELAYQFKNSNAKMVATIPEILPTVQKAAAEAGVSGIIVIDESEQRGDSSLISYSSLIKDTGSYFNPISVDAENDIAVLPYSSGTTGLPKGVMLTHNNVAANILQMEHPQIFDLRQGDTCLLGVLPFFHIYGMVVTLFSTLYTGSKVVALPKFEPDLFLSAIERFRINLAHLVPPLVLFLAKHPSVDNYDISSIDQIMSGAAPLGGDLVKTARERIGCRLIRQGYGLTETSPVTHVMPQDLGMSKPDSIGMPIRSVETKVVHVESGETLSTGQEGEIWIRGPNVMKGYLNLPDATTAMLTQDKWLRTGDIGYFDEEGCFYITDRLKELIKVKGFQVAPAELEAILVTNPKIADAAVIGVPNEWLGEAPKAFVVKKDPSITESEVMEYVASQVSEFKQLAGGVEFIEAVPKSASGKILRRMLRKQT